MQKAKWTAIILAAGTLLLSAGCADKSSVDTTEQVTTSTTAETTQDTTAETTAVTTSATKKTTAATTSSTGTTTSASVTTGTGSASNGSGQQGNSGGSGGNGGNGQQGNSGNGQQGSSQQRDTQPELQALSNCYAAGYINWAFPAGGSNVAVITADYSNGKGPVCNVYDIQKDQAVSSFSFRDDYDAPIGVNRAGELVCSCPEGRTVRYYNLMTGTLRTVTFGTPQDEIYGELSYDYGTDAVYSNEGDTIFRITNTGKKEKVCTYSDPLSYALLRDSVNSIQYVRDFSNDDATGYDLTGISLADGKIVSHTPLYADEYKAAGKYLLGYFTKYNNETERLDVNCYVIDPVSGREIKRYYISHSSSDMVTDPRTNYAVQIVRSDVNYSPTGFRFCNPTAGTYEELGINLKSAEGGTACYLPDCRKWVVAVTESVGGKTRTRLLTVDPELAKFDQTYPPAANLKSDAPPLGAAYAANRAKADKIEQDLGIRILIGNEVRRTTNTSYDLVSTEDTSYQPGSVVGCNDQQMLSNGLDFLRKQLSRYPEGFLQKFRAKNGAGGLRILITLDLPPLDPNSNFSAGGVQFKTGAWYDIAINLFMLQYEDASIHHEMWHAAEYLMSENGVNMDYDTWMAMNPPGLQYDSIEDYGSDDSKWQYILYSSEDPYFARIYGTANEREDRATITEQIFMPYYVDETDRNETHSYDYLMRYPHMKAKIQYMEQKLTEYYGYVYWKKMMGIQ